MEVAKHFVQLPGADEPDDVSVDVGKQEGVGARSTKRAGGDVVLGKAERSAKEGGGVAEQRRGDLLGRPGPDRERSEIDSPTTSGCPPP